MHFFSDNQSFDKTEETPELTLEELSYLHLGGVVGEASQLDHGVLVTVLGEPSARPGVAGVLHLRVLDQNISQREEDRELVT